MTTLLPGELRYRIGTEENHYIVHGGFMDVRGGLVVVLADAAEHVNEIEEARAEEAIARAQQRITPRGDGVDLERALASLHRAQTRLKITRLRRKQRPVGIGSAPQ